MNRSRNFLSALETLRQRGGAAPERRSTCALTERRGTDRRLRGAGRSREQRLQAVNRAAEIGVYDLDWLTGAAYCSPELARIAGLAEDPGDRLLERLLAAVHPQDRERVAAGLKASFHPGGAESFTGEFRFLHPDGGVRWVKLRACSFFAGQPPERRLLGASGLATDITELRVAEAILRDQSAELQLAMRVGNSGTFQWNPRTGEHRWSNEMLALYGLRPEGFGGRDDDWLACLLPEDRAAAVAAVRRALAGGDYAAEFGIRRRDTGEIRRLSARGQVFFDAGGRPLRLLGINMDITDMRRREAEGEESRARLTAVLDSLSEGVVISDLSGRVLNMNPAALRLHGYAKVEQARRHLSEFPDTFELHTLDGRPLPLEDWPLGRLRRGESFSDYTLKLRRRDQDWSAIVSFNGNPVRTSGGEPSLGVITVRDVGERIRAESALRESERRLAVALQASGSLVWEIDVASGRHRGGEALYAMLGHAPADFMTLEECLSIVHEDDRGEVRNGLLELIAGRRDSYRRELRMRTRAGHWHWILSQAAVADRDADGRATRLVGTHTDINERKAAEAALGRLNAELESHVLERTAELQRANDALLHSNAELRHFAHATAHDLQTPLRSIVGFSQLVRDEVRGRVDPRVEEWTALVIDNATRLQLLIRELLAYAQLDAQGLPFEKTDLNALFAQVRDSLAGLIAQSGAEIDCGDLPTLCIDPTQIAQLLQNLVENAVKYNRSRPPRVAVVGEGGDGQWVFSVRDNGIGIDPRQHERIFDIFHRLHSYQQVPGTGIGLALCRRIVERHGGRIWVESEPARGSCFYFSLPAAGECTP